MASEFERSNFYNEIDKTLFNLDFKLVLGGFTHHNIDSGNRVSHTNQIPNLDLVSFEIAQEIFTTYFKSKPLASFMTQLSYIFNAQLPHSNLRSYEHLNVVKRYYQRGQTVDLDPEVLKDRLEEMQKNIKYGFLFNKGILDITPSDPANVYGLQYTRNTISLNLLDFNFQMLTDKDKLFQPQLCLYSKSHIDKTSAFIKRIHNFYAKEEGMINSLTKLKDSMIKHNTEGTYIKTKFSPKYGLYSFDRGNKTGMEMNVDYEYRITEKDFLDFALTLIERVKLNFEHLHKLFTQHNLRPDSISSVEYEGSFARSDDFKNQKYYVYMAKSAKGDVGFVGINPASAKGYNSSRHSLSIVKDVSQALTFKTKNPLETGFKELSPDSYYIKDIHPLEIETKFSATNDSYADPKMQAIATMLMKKELQENIQEIPFKEKEELATNLTSIPIKKNKI